MSTKGKILNKKDAFSNIGTYNAKDVDAAKYPSGWSIENAKSKMAESQYYRYSKAAVNTKNKLVSSQSLIKLPKSSFKNVSVGSSRRKGEDPTKIIYLSVVPFREFEKFAREVGLVDERGEKTEKRRLREVLSPVRLPDHPDDEYVVIRLSGGVDEVLDIMRIYGMDLSSAAASLSTSKNIVKINPKQNRFRDFANRLIEEYALTGERITDDMKSIRKDFLYAWAYEGERKIISTPTYHQIHAYAKVKGQYEKMPIDLLLYYTIGTQYITDKSAFSRVTTNGVILEGMTSKSSVYKRSDVVNFTKRINELDDTKFIAITDNPPKTMQLREGKVPVGYYKLEDFEYGRDTTYDTSGANIFLKMIRKQAVSKGTGATAKSTTQYNASYDPREVLETFAGKIGAKFSDEYLKSIEIRGKKMYAEAVAASKKSPNEFKRVERTEDDDMQTDIGPPEGEVEVVSNEESVGDSEDESERESEEESD